LFKKSLTWMKENKKIESITNPQTKKVSFISDFHKILNIKNNLNLEAYNLPFNRLKHIFDKTPFGLILACGNILADVDNLNEFKYYLLDLFNIMDVQSLLVFDIRNFTRMQDSLNMEDEKSYKDFINNKYSGNYVYTGKNIIGAPRKIIKGKIEFVFYNKQTDDLINTFTSNDKKYSNVLMYNLKVNEIYDILKEQERVSNVEIFLDYQFDKKIDIDKVKEYELNSKIDKEQELTNDYFVFVVELK
ncbi:MAG TPA: hypothetical protein VJ697_03435, partial [Nitrososphaeraceae archaeon]|nr:hypothetical protein [Nitrososphaeraceae archaeon]